MRSIVHYLVSGLTFLVLLMVFATPPALAFDSITGSYGGAVSGFLHPIVGIDHQLAMFAVGIWGALLGGRAVWTLPVVFPFVMAIGGVLGVLGVPLPLAEMAIGLSIVVLGMVIFTAWVAPIAIASVIVGSFAIFHGYAHGLELPSGANPIAYGLGFVAATGIIHIAGVGFGLLAIKPAKGWVARASGGAIAAAGVYFLIS